MLKTYVVLGRNIQANPDIEYLKPSNMTARKLMEGSAMFYQINVESFLASVRDLPKEFYDDFYEGIGLHLMECKSILGFIKATEGDYNATKVVMDGPVESPNPTRTEELKLGLENTISLFKQLQRQ